MAARKDGNEETGNKLRKGKTVISKSVTETSYYVWLCQLSCLFRWMLFGLNSGAILDFPSAACEEFLHLLTEQLYPCPSRQLQNHRPNSKHTDSSTQATSAENFKKHNNNPLDAGKPSGKHCG